jgi:hypothetical protein
MVPVDVRELRMEKVWKGGCRCHRVAVGAIDSSDNVDAGEGLIWCLL